MDKQWLKTYEQYKEKFRCKIDLESYFVNNKIGSVNVDMLEIGNVNLPTGKIVACDPLVDLGYTKPFLQDAMQGSFPVKIAVVPSEKYSDRYACVKVEFTKQKPVIYELAVTGEELEMDSAEEGDIYGFPVDAGMGCVVDKATQDAFIKYFKMLEETQGTDNPFDDLLEDLLTENASKYPKYQSEDGDWVNWTIPETDLNIPIFQSGWGDGYYASYFGYDENKKLCGFYILFIDIEKEYAEE